MNNKFYTFFLLLPFTWIIAIFLFNPHYIELTGVLETWLPYKGLVYYKDFAAFHLPLGRLILLPIHILADWRTELDPFVALVFGLGTLKIIYDFGKEFLSKIATLLSLIFFAIFFWYAATGILFFHEILIGWLLALILWIYFKAHSEKKISIQTSFILGILISTTELSGQIATFTLAVIYILVTTFLLKSKNKSIKIIALNVGVLAPIAITSAYFLLNNAFGEFFYYNVTYYLQYAGYDKNFWTLPHLILLAFYAPLIASLLISVILKKFKLTSRISQLSLLSLSSIPFIVFSVYHPHHLNYAIPVLALNAGVAYDFAVKNKITRTLVSVTITIISFVFVYKIIPWHTSRIVLPPKSFKVANDTYPDDPMYQVIQWIKQNTNKNATLMVLGDSMIYLKSDRIPANRPAKGGIPYSWEPFDSVKQEISQKPPDYWIIGNTFTRRLREDYNKGYMVDFVEEQIEKCCSLVYEDDVWQIWQDNKIHE